VAKFGVKHGHGELSVVRGRLISWNGEMMTIFNTTFLDSHEHSPPSSTRITSDGSLPRILNYKQAGGNIIALATADSIRVYDVISLAPPSSGDFIGNYRFLIIAVAICVVVGWKLFNNKKSKEEAIAEKLGNMQS
jgi:hypothetical protein